MSIMGVMATPAVGKIPSRVPDGLVESYNEAVRWVRDGTRLITFESYCMQKGLR